MHAPTEQERTIATLLAQVTPEQQAVFDVAYYTELAEQLAEAEQHEAFDPDVVELTMLRTWRAYCNNERLPDDDPQAPLPGYTVPVWVSPAGTVMTYTLGRLPASPTADNPRDPTARTRPSMHLVFISSLAAMICVAAGWRMLASPSTLSRAAQPSSSSSTEVTTSPASPTPLSDVRTTAELADPVSLELGTDGTRVWRVVRSDGVLGSPWTPPLDAGTVAWLGSSVINPIICFPHADDATLRHLRRNDSLILRLASGVTRTYTVLHVQQVGRQAIERFDQHALRITLVACGMSGNDRTVVDALYHLDERGLPQAPAHDRIVIPSWVTIERNDLRIDTAPSGARVTLTLRITNQSGGDLALADLDGRLLVGGVAQATDLLSDQGRLTDGASSTITRSYAVENGARGQQAMWQGTMPDGQQALLLLGTLNW